MLGDNGSAADERDEILTKDSDGRVKDGLGNEQGLHLDAIFSEKLQTGTYNISNLYGITRGLIFMRFASAGYAIAMTNNSDDSVTLFHYNQVGTSLGQSSNNIYYDNGDLTIEAGYITNVVIIPG